MHLEVALTIFIIAAVESIISFARGVAWGMCILLNGKGIDNYLSIIGNICVIVIICTFLQIIPVIFYNKNHRCTGLWVRVRVRPKFGKFWKSASGRTSGIFSRTKWPDFLARKSRAVENFKRKHFAKAEKFSNKNPNYANICYHFGKIEA